MRCRNSSWFYERTRLSFAPSTGPSHGWRTASEQYLAKCSKTPPNWTDVSLSVRCFITWIPQKWHQNWEPGSSSPSITHGVFMVLRASAIYKIRSYTIQYLLQYVLFFVKFLANFYSRSPNKGEGAIGAIPWHWCGYGSSLSQKMMAFFDKNRAVFKISWLGNA